MLFEESFPLSLLKATRPAGKVKKASLRCGAAVCLPSWGYVVQNVRGDKDKPTLGLAGWFNS